MAGYNHLDLIDNRGTQVPPATEGFTRRHPEWKTRGTYTYMRYRETDEEPMRPASERPFPIVKVLALIAAAVALYFLMPADIKALLRSMYEFALGR